jgi:hypothetical protein
MATHFGICPSSEELSCSRSYTCFKTLPAGLTHWLGFASLPEGGSVLLSVSPPLKTACESVFQKVNRVPSFCDECGTELIFVAEIPSLGMCECTREYSKVDLTKSFCSACGKPISIDEQIRMNFERMCSIQALFDSVPQFQTYGYLPALSNS